MSYDEEKFCVQHVNALLESARSECESIEG